MTPASYADSHTRPGKGRQYDAVYREDAWHRWLWDRERQVLERLLSDQFAGPVDMLDFACGTGRIASALEDKVRSVVGVDISAPMLEVAKEKLHATTLFLGDLLAGPLFPPRTFQLITAFRFFVNAEPALRVAALKALVPYLAEDGYLVFNNHQNSDSAYIRLTRAYARWKGFAFANTLSMAECDALMEGAGLEIVRVYPVAMLHLPRIAFPRAVYRTAEWLGGLSPALARRSESPILVARRRRR